MTPREFEIIVSALKEYRDAESRQAQELMAKHSKTHTIGGGIIRND
jgi:hypothetical protein